MNKKTKRITFSAMMTALAVICLYFMSIFPTGRYGFAAAASLFGIAAVIETGLVGGAFVYAASSVLSLLILPDKTDLMLYILFFGYYPIVKSLAEQMKTPVLTWGIKLVVVNIAFTVILKLFSALVFDYADLLGSTALVYLAMNAIFVLFDIGVSKMISYYMIRIRK